MDKNKNIKFTLNAIEKEGTLLFAFKINGSNIVVYTDELLENIESVRTKFNVSKIDNSNLIPLDTELKNKVLVFFNKLSKVGSNADFVSSKDNMNNNFIVPVFGTDARLLVNNEINDINYNMTEEDKKSSVAPHYLSGFKNIYTNLNNKKSIEEINVEKEISVLFDNVIKEATSINEQKYNDAVKYFEVFIPKLSSELDEAKKLLEVATSNKNNSMTSKAEVKIKDLEETIDHLKNQLNAKDELIIGLKKAVEDLTARLTTIYGKDDQVDRKSVV